jgi:hypothetical protein
MNRSPEKQAEQSFPYAAVVKAKAVDSSNSSSQDFREENDQTTEESPIHPYSKLSKEINCF